MENLQEMSTPKCRVVDISRWLKVLQNEGKEETIVSDTKGTPKTDYSAVPEEMKLQKNWVCWSLEERNGKQTKVPKNPRTGGNASVTLSGTWGTFAQAEAYYVEHPENISGIGYVFTEASGIIGIDFDHVIENGRITNEEIQSLVARCGSYVEVSPSGTGLHMYVKGKWKGTGRKNNNLGGGMAIEVYPSARFFTVTGGAYNEAGTLKEEQELLDFIYDRYFTEKEENGATLPVRLEELGVEQLYLNRLQDKLQNPRSWLALLWQGNHTKESDSEADMALICRLLLICDGDEEAVRKLFMASPYACGKDRDHRGKLDREDYWRMSIDNAMEYLERHPEFDRCDRYRPLLRFDGDNDGNASMLFEYMDGNVRFCKEQESWLVYKDGCWVNDSRQQEIKSQALDMYQGLKATIKAIAREQSDDTEEIKKTEAGLLKKIKSFGTTAGKNSVIAYAQSYKDFTISEKQLDSHDDLLGAGNGVINLRTGELLPFDRQLYITRRTEVNYDPNAPEPTRFLQFLNEISGGNQEWIDYLQLALGYCITGCTNQEAFFVFHGETGQNGKSTLLKLLYETLFPQIVTTMNKVALSESKSNTELNSPLAKAKNFRMVITNENDGKHRLDEALVRGIASGESPNIRDLYEKSDSNNNNSVHYKIVFCGNYVPKFDWRLRANLRRLCLIPFNITIANSKVDTDLNKKLREECEGILAWIVRGAMRSFKENVTKNKPLVIQEYTQALMYEEDPVYAFSQEEIIATDDPEDTIQSLDLFESYNDWREFNNLPRQEYKKHIPGFGNRLKSLGYKKKFDAKKCVVYTGIRLRSENHEDEATEPEE